MHLNWQERLTFQAELWDFEKWPQVLITDLPSSKRQVFLKNKKIVAKVLGHETTLQICSDLHVSKSKVSKLLSRCLAGDEDEEPALTQGMIPNIKIRTPHRKAPLSTLKLNRGANCSFKYLLEAVTGLKKYLDNILFAHFKDKPESEQLKFENFFNSFINYLGSHNWPKDTYPYTELSVGRESLRIYMHQRLLEMQQKSLLKNDFETHPLPVLAKKLFSEIQIDEHTYDSMCSVILEFNGVPIELRVSRISMILAVEVSTSCNLSYVVVLNRAPNQFDFIECLAGIYKPWKEIQITTPGIIYDLNSGFASGNIFTSDNAPVIEQIFLDNAMIHHANNVRSFIVNKMGGECHIGKPASPKDRNWVEFAFKMAAKNAHRFRSTTGSNSVDPKKESNQNQKKPPIVNLKTLEETIEVTLAAENARARAHLGSLTPLQMMETQLKNHYIPRYFKEQIDEICSNLHSKNVLVKHSKNENRAPHINFCYQSYRGECLIGKNLVNKEITITYDSKDIRILTAFYQGKRLGVLYAPKSWQTYAHSIKTRKLINRLVKEKKLDHKDPLVGYFDYVLENKGKSKGALELIRVYREYNQQTTFSPSSNPYSKENSLLSFESEETFPAWTPELSGIGTNEHE